MHSEDSIVRSLRFTNSALNQFVGSNEQTTKVTIKDTESSGLRAIRFPKSGMVSFIYTGRIKGGLKRNITIGRYPDTGIEEARSRASELRKLYRQGIDPKQLEEQERAAEEREKALERALQVSLRAVLERYLLAN